MVKEAIGIGDAVVDSAEKKTAADTFHPAYYEDSCTAVRGSEDVPQHWLERFGACIDAVAGVDRWGSRCHNHSPLEVAVSSHIQTSSA